MAHHKRGRAKNQRSGCLFCKPHKQNGVNDEKASVARLVQDKVPDLETDYGLSNDDDENGCQCVMIGDQFIKCSYCEENMLRLLKRGEGLTAKIGEIVRAVA